MRTSAARHIVAPQIAIVILLAAISSGIAQECRTSLDKRLVIAEEARIWTVDANGQNRETLSTATFPVSLEYDYASNALYWSDWELREVLTLGEKSSKPRIGFPSQKTWLPSGIALDYVSGKIYLADSASGVVRVADLKNKYQTIILSNNLTEVKDVELDLHEGYLFVLDKYQILRTELDGSNRKVIYSKLGQVTEILKHLLPKSILDGVMLSRKTDPDAPQTYKKAATISDIVVDVKTKRVYFVDTVTRRIESIDYDGNDRKVHFEDSNAEEKFEALSTLALIDDALYYSNHDTMKVHKIDLTGNNHKVILDGVWPLAIKGISCSDQQSADNACKNTKGKCEQLCLLSKSGKKNYKCACSTGYLLGKDGKSCVPVQDFLLYAEQNFLRGQSLESNGPITDVINPSQYNLGSYSELDYDAQDRLVFYTSQYPDSKLHQIYLDTSEQTIMEPDLLSKDVASFTYDWVTKNLYYFTYYYADVTTLNVVNVKNPTYSKIVMDNVQRLVRSIVVHPNKGYLFIAQNYDECGHIKRVNTDGSGLTELRNLRGVSLNTLAMDYENDRLYWFEYEAKPRNGSYNSIYHSDLDGKDIQDVPLPKGFSSPSALYIQGDYLYAVSGDAKITRLDKKQGGKATILTERTPHGGISDIKVFSKAIQSTRPDHPCSSNHSCQKFCFAVPSSNESLKGVCGCPYGEKLAADGKNCVDNSKEEPPFVPCKYTSFKCNMQKQETV